ncbi:MAG: Na+/H+ antiporter NhaC family protein [Oscillospiraceae bacterium]|nr:Na+/H+ antiporter NhaC family protein [Oscillospiraceae bacterium]
MSSLRSRRVLTGAFAAVTCLSLTLAAFAAEGEVPASSMYGTFWALVPPAVAIVLALITKEAYSSLFIGILVGALFQCNFAPVATLDTIINDGMIAAIADSAGIFLFLVLLGVIVALINASGGSAAFGRWAEKNIKSRVGAMLATFILGVLIFVDDYFNCLTVGSVMLPITDRNKVSRPKLAYLIDATAAPICMIAPISSWAAAVSGVAADLDTGISGIQLFIRAIPYNFYSLLTFVFVIGLAVMNFDYGPMRKFEEKARKTGDVSGIDSGETEKGNPKGIVADLVIPVVVLIIFCILGMIYVGGFWDSNAGDFIAAFSDTDAYVALPWGGLVALVIAVIYLVARRVLTFRQAMECVPKGFFAMVPPITILTLAVSLKTMTNMLGADVFVYNVMYGASERLYSMLPAVIFVVACFLAFASGTSWGTFGILIPIVVAIFDPSSTLLTIGISACLAGAVCGDHCSPISDTTIMASAGAQCDHVTHVSTQLPYALTVAGVSFVSFIIAGFVQNAIVCLALGAALMIAVLFVLRSVFGRKTA